MSGSHWHRPTLLIVLAILACSPSVAAAQWWTTSYLKDSAPIYELFQEVVGEARGWTVRVKSARQDVALGVVVDAGGYVLTKASQLKENVTCALHDGRELPAQVVGVHRKYDLALLKIDADDLPSVVWNLDDPQVGRWAITPGTDALPLAVGVISVLPREIPNDASFLGVQFADAEPGARIVDVLAGGAASRAGLKADDIVLELSGKAVRDGDSLRAGVGEVCPGDAFLVRVRRGNRLIDIPVIMGSLVDDFSHANEKPLLFQIGSPLSLRRSGFPRAMQHDSVLSPQDCGGCLLGIDGRAVGINIARADRTMTHAIAAHDVVPLIEELKSGRLAPTSRGGLVLVQVPAPPLPTQTPSPRRAPAPALPMVTSP